MESDKARIEICHESRDNFMTTESLYNMAFTGILIRKSRKQKSFFNWQMRLKMQIKNYANVDFSAITWIEPYHGEEVKWKTFYLFRLLRWYYFAWSQGYLPFTVITPHRNWSKKSSGRRNCLKLHLTEWFTTMKRHRNSLKNNHFRRLKIYITGKINGILWSCGAKGSKNFPETSLTPTM